MSLFTAIWNSHEFGILLWCIFATLIFGPVIVAWYKDRQAFDIFESKHIFVLIFFLYYGIPSLYYLIRPRDFPFVTNFDQSLKLVILAAIVGLLSFYLGNRIQIRRNLPFFEEQWNLKRLMAIMVVYVIGSGLSFAGLMHRVGGACYYFTHLGQTNVSLAGNIYFVWGIMLFKSATLLLAAYMFKTRPKQLRWWAGLALMLTISAALITFVGARIFLVVYIVELLILCHYLWRRLSFKLLAGLGVVMIVLVIGVLGEFRTFSWSAPDICQNQSQSALTPTPAQSSGSGTVAPVTPTGTPKPVPTITVQQYSEEFAQQLTTVASDKELLLSRYIDNYFDSVRTTMMVFENTPDKLPYQYGLGYAQIVVQPIPRGLRPSISLGESQPIFSEGEGYGRVISMIGESYINFSLSGLIFIPVLLGLACRLMSDFVKKRTSNSWAVLVYAVFIGGLMTGIRGFFVGSTSLFLMDLVPLLLAFAVMSWGAKKPK